MGKVHAELGFVPPILSRPPPEAIVASASASRWCSFSFVSKSSRSRAGRQRELEYANGHTCKELIINVGTSGTETVEV